MFAFCKTQTLVSLGFLNSPEWVSMYARWKKSWDQCAVRLLQVWLYHWTRLTVNVLLQKHNIDLVMAQTPFELQDYIWGSKRQLGLLSTDRAITPWVQRELVMARSRGVTALAGSLFQWSRHRWESLLEHADPRFFLLSTTIRRHHGCWAHQQCPHVIKTASLSFPSDA